MVAMKAAILKSLGAPLAIESVPAPVLGTGEVIVDVAATRVLAYAGEVFSGQRRYLLDLPVIPGTGGIGRVRETGPDATHLEVGDWVFCDPTVRSRDDAVAPDILLQGLTAGSEGGRRLQKYFGDGSYAQRVRVPTENVARLGTIDASKAANWCAFGTMLVPYGGFLAVSLLAGDTVVVNGATGAFGGGAVAVALAMGAGAVIATGRNQAALDGLARRYGSRVRPVRMVGDEEKDRSQIMAAAVRPIDVVIDLLPPMATVAQVRTALLTARPYGRVVLMGGVGMGGQGGLDLPYSWMMRNCVTVRGQWMYPRDAAVRLIAMVQAGLLSLDGYEVTSFPLDKANEAVAHAAENTGPFRMTVLRP
jgi:alcohol dehydrogenase